MTAFSILVCTHNGGEKLFDTLGFISKLKVDNSISFEVIVVDNAPISNMEAKFNEYTSKLNPDISFFYYVEPKKGKDHALKLAIEKSKNEWVIICDDDNWLMADYLVVAKSLILRFTDVVVFGAKSTAVFEEGFVVPDWFTQNQLKYACGSQYDKSEYVSYRQNIWGAGSLYLKSVLSYVLNIEDLILSNNRGEDTEIFYRVILLNQMAYYSSNLEFQHFMPSSRLILDNHTKMNIQDVQSFIVLDKYNKFIKYYHLNDFKYLSKLKWSVIAILRELKLLYMRDKVKSETLINIHTTFSKDLHMNKIKRYYKLSQKNQVLFKK